MRLTRQSEIAVAILAACARRPGEQLPTSTAAREAAASKAHTAKVVHLLVHGGFLVATRGRRGGLRLAKPAEVISLSGVLQHMQPELIESSDRAPRRGTHGHLDMIADAARSIVTALLDRFTIADLVTRPAIHRMACADCHLMKAQHSAAAATSARSRQQSPKNHVLHNG